jgi:hypothetical protein
MQNQIEEKYGLYLVEHGGFIGVHAFLVLTKNDTVFKRLDFFPSFKGEPCLLNNPKFKIVNEFNEKAIQHNKSEPLKMSNIPDRGNDFLLLKGFFDDALGKNLHDFHWFHLHEEGTETQMLDLWGKIVSIAEFITQNEYLFLHTEMLNQTKFQNCRSGLYAILRCLKETVEIPEDPMFQDGTQSLMIYDVSKQYQHQKLGL